MERYFNKLVRDNIPDIIKNNNEVAVTRTLNEEEYRVSLYKKLFEECNEVRKSKNRSETLEELADVLEIVKSIAELEGKELNDVASIANQKRLNRGGFRKRIFLEKTITK